MKYIRLFALAILMMAGACQTATAQKNIQVPKAYIFGFAASFNDSTVFFTQIQEVDSVWINKKKGFLAGWSQYSYQLRNYCASEMNLPSRTCVVVSSIKRKDVEKKFDKMMKKYRGSKKGKKGKNDKYYDIRLISTDNFRFETVDMSE